jgi:hypothetical protein
MVVIYLGKFKINFEKKKEKEKDSINMYVCIYKLVQTDPFQLEWTEGGLILVNAGYYCIICFFFNNNTPDNTQTGSPSIQMDRKG